MQGIAGDRNHTGVRGEMLRYLGYRGQELSEEMEQKLDSVLEEARSLSRPRRKSASFPLRFTEDGAALEGTSLVLTGKDIVRHLSGAEEAVLFAVTLGAAAERRMLLYEKQDMIRAVLLDAAFSALVEEAADDYEKILVEEAAARGFATNWRFSPGYGDLPLELQKGFARVLDLSRSIGVTVTENSLMIPRKTVTAVIGLFDPEKEPSGKRLGCSDCILGGDCEFRRWGRTCWQR